MLNWIKSYAFLILLLLVIFPSFSFSQINDRNFDVEFGPEIRASRKEVVDEIIGKDENGIFAMSRSGIYLTIYLYSNNLLLNKKNTVTLKYLGNELQYKGLIRFGTQFILFSTFLDKKNKTTYLFSQVLNKETLMFSSPKELGSNSYDGYRRRESANYTFTTSADSNYLLFVTDLPVSSENTEKFGLIVFDKSMNEVWRNENILVDKGSKDFDRYQVMVGNDAHVYLLAKIYDKSNKGIKKWVDYTYKMMIYEPNKTPVTVDVLLENQFVTDISFRRLENGNFQIVGFYSGDGEGQDGVFNLVYNKYFEIINHSKTKFLTEFIVQHETEQIKKRAEKNEARGKDLAMYSYTIDEVIENYDSSVTMIAEQYFEYNTSYSDIHGNEITTTYYVHGNIVIVKFNHLGEVEWMELIPKKQVSSDGGYYSGYGMMQLENGNLAIIFNDNPKNSYKYKMGKIFSWAPNTNNTDFVLYEITDEGYVNREVVYNCADEQVWSLPSVSMRITENEMVIIGQTKRRTKLVKLVFRD
jgi:hypothetical protein